MSKIIVLDPGHGGTDPGAVANGLQEKVLTLNIAKRIRKYLNDNYKGHKVLMTRTTDKFVSLANRAAHANRNKADLFVSIHINSGGGTGYEDFVYSGVSNASTTAKHQKTINKEIARETGFTNRGTKKDNFAVLRLTNMPAILTESGFIDRKADADKLKQSRFLDKIAKGHAIGIAKALGLKKKKSSNTSKPPVSKPNPPSKPKTKPLEWVGTNLKGRRVESIYRGRDGLNFYDGPRWTNPTGTFNYGTGWKIDNLYRVNGSLMYRVQNSAGKLYWITANSKYVTIKGKY